MRQFLIFASLITLSACSGRAAVEVPITQASDYQLSCEQIAAEQQSIAAKVNALRAEDQAAHNSNVAIGVVGTLIFWPALFALDTGTAEEQEINAYRARSQHLNTVAGARGCYGATAWQAPQPVTTPLPQPTYQAPQPTYQAAQPAQQTPAPTYQAAPAYQATEAAVGSSASDGCNWNPTKYRYECW